eukprot:UN11101
MIIYRSALLQQKFTRTFISRFSNLLLEQSHHITTLRNLL